MAEITVLLVDDHTIVREATAEMVDHQPDMCVVGQAGTGEEAVVLARQVQPDVIVMDIAMPRTDGLEATRRIIAESPESRVLVLTAHEEEDYIIQVLQAGAMGYLFKSVGLDDLLEAIRAVARGDSVLPPAVATVVVRHVAGKRTPVQAGPTLTDREMEVLRLAAKGLTNYDIAQRLYISVRTTEAHLTHIYSKLGVSSRTEAVVYAMRKGWVRAEDTR